MVSSEVQRTLVKSPPELWAELSDPAALARHLGELGEIRIVETKPEERVEWETDGATGKVLIKPSGWGTKVTLSITREIVEPAVEEPETEEPQAEQTPAAVDVVPGVAEPESNETEAKEPETEPEATEATKPRRSFFSRLFRRRSQPDAEPLALAEPIAVSELAVPEMPPETTAETPSEAALEPSADISAELREAEETATDEITAILTAVLDRLGAAHHRPFSRA